ncbi:dynein regulatory complex subunit 6-like isoform X2 [Mya arenaria]|uniref:dynein regulatory complex subunit 6-like isoform X1 n=1 Tax=Mya arenaria TaxID=6604 RepID=UPI0022E379FA|nr:dynein regulatory complex subunit 6-like isoform X1 [Mya arenaria]XP_052780818.1 dynein regulatory complex subunit 6-like isoform X2 [Mya arenaria]
MAASMKGLDPVLKRYLRSNKLPDVYEALITGLAVMCPEDPHQFIIDNLKYLIEFGTDGLEWDLFVEEFMKPLNKVVSESNLEFIFNMDDESMLEGPIPKRILHLLQPTPEMYEKAYLHYNTKSMKVTFCSWMQYYLRKKRKRLDMEEKMTRATTFHSHRTLKLYLDEWIEWVKYRKGRQAMAYQKISHVLNVSIGRVIFEAWHSHTLDARRQREYFEINLRRLERGENMEDDDAFGQGTGEARDSISNLPRKVAIQIFRYVDVADLARCACVCRSWKVITQANSLWNRLDFHRVRNRISRKLKPISEVTDKVVTKLLYKCRPYLIHLNMRGCMFISEPSFISISECSNLQDLNFSECTGLNDEHLKLVAKGCKILLYLNISHTLVTDASLRTIAKNCSNLQYLSMAHCKKFTDRGLLYLSAGKNSKKLDYIDLSGCLQITPDGFKNLSNGCTNLQTLLLNDFPTLSDDCLFPVAAKLTKISTLSLLGSPNLSDEAFKRIASNKNLKKIKIEGNQRISDASLKQIGQSCVNLEHIYIADCQRLTDLALKALAPCKHLAVANFADCVRVGEKGVRALVEGPCGPRLREFNLTNCICVNDMTMVHIHKRCHNLTYLSLCFCEHLSEAGIELIGQIHSLTSVDISGCNCGDQGLAALGNNSRRDVTLSECVNITDLGLQKFAQQCKNIERLDLSHCMQITDGAIKNLAFCCRMLNVLNLAGCKLVTDLSIQYLSGVCHYLVQLDVSGCLLITDKALKYLRKGCKKLSLLILLYCKGVTKNSAQKMMRHVDTVQYNNDEVPSYFGY